MPELFLTEMASAPIFSQPTFTQVFLFAADDFRRFRAGGNPVWIETPCPLAPTPPASSGAHVLDIDGRSRNQRALMFCRTY